MDYWKDKNMKIGIGIISWNRPKYLKQLINSLENNNLKDCDFYLFQDGYTCKFTNKEVANPKNISDSIKVFHDSKLPNKNYHIRDKNVSIAINQFEAMNFLSLHYNKFIFLENDVIVSPNFIAVMKKLLNQFEKDKRVACISPSFRLHCKPNKIKENLNRLFFKRGHFWAEACWAEKWIKITKEFIPYYNIVKNSPYRKRDEGAIKKLFSNSGIKM